MHEDAIGTLGLFIEKVERLQSLSLVKALTDRGLKVNIKFDAETGVEVNWVGPSPEQVEAFVLTLRMFMQDNERISVRRTAELLNALPVPDELKTGFVECRTSLNKGLDGGPAIIVQGEPLTPRDILETILYGHLSHLEEKHCDRYRLWGELPTLQEMMDYQFVCTLVFFLRSLMGMAEVCRDAIAALDTPPANGQPVVEPARRADSAPDRE